MVDFIELLKKEVVPAEGCTEPIAVAYAVSIAAEQLEGEPTDIRLKLSANIIKNALGVGIPGTGMVGIEIAAALGAVVRQSEKKLEVLSGFTPEHLAAAKALVDAHAVRVEQKATSEALYIEAMLRLYGEMFVRRGTELVNAFEEDIVRHGVGCVCELYDGDPPHEPHGAISSACSTAALLRADYLMNKYKEERK